MPSLNGPGRFARRRRWLVPAAAGCVLAGLVVALYMAVPWLAGHMAPRLAGSVGLDELHLVVERPGLRGLEVRSLALSSGGMHLSASDGSIEYLPAGLLTGQLKGIQFRRMRVRLATSRDAGEAPGAPPPTVQDLFALLPAERVGVETLVLEVPGQGFRALGSLQVRNGQLDLHLTGLAPEQAEGFELSAHATADGMVRAHVGVRDEDRPPFLALTSQVIGGRLVADGELALGGFALDLAAALAGAPAGDGRVDGTFSASLPWPLPSGWTPGVFAAEGRLSASWEPSSAGWAVADGEADWRLEEGILRGRAAGTVQHRDRAFTVRASSDGLRLTEPAGTGRLVLADGSDESPLTELIWNLQEHHLAVDGEFRLSGPLLADITRQAGLPPGGGSLSGTISTRLPWPLPEQDWAGLRPPSRGSLQGRWAVDDGGIGVSGLDADWHLENGQLSATADGRVTYGDMSSAAGVTLDALTLDGSAVSARGTVALGGAVLLPFTGRHDTETAQGALSVSADVSVDAPLADDVVDDWQAPYDVTAGELAVAVEVEWRGARNVDGNARVDLEALDAHFRDYAISGISGKLSFALGAGGALALSPSPLHLAVVDTGVEVRHVDTSVAWSGDTLTVQTTTARLLGGSARLDPFAYDLTEGKADVVVDVADVDLARVLALEGDHVSGTGVLNGTLPVRVRGHEPSIVAGQVRSEPPGGVIRVSRALTEAAGQPGLDFALRALQDFQYSLLEADVAYSPEGDLTLAVRLEGRNPDIEGGRPIHYNVTVNENLPTLLKSLRLQDQVTREIERQVTD